MWSFLAEFLPSKRPLQVIIVEESGAKAPRQYSITPGKLFWSLCGTALSTRILVTIILLCFTPLPQYLLGDSVHLQQEARLNAKRLAALQDSLDMQRQYVSRMQSLFLNRTDSSDVIRERQGVPVRVTDQTIDSKRPPLVGPVEAPNAFDVRSGLAFTLWSSRFGEHHGAG